MTDCVFVNRKQSHAITEKRATRPVTARVAITENRATAITEKRATSCGRVAFFQALPEAVTVTVTLDDVTVMGDAIQQRAG